MSPIEYESISSVQRQAYVEKLLRRLTPGGDSQTMLYCGPATWKSYLQRRQAHAAIDKAKQKAGLR